MAAINDEVYARVREKIKEHNLTEQEVKVIDTARDKLQSHTYGGGFIGASTAYFIARRKKFNPLQIFAVAAGGFLIGSQMGLISGALAGIKAINTLPNPQRLINVIREVQMEAVKGRQGVPGGNRPTLRPQQMSNQEMNEAQNPPDQFSPDINDNMSGEKVWDNKPSYSAAPEKQDHDFEKSTLEKPQKPQASAWDKIRAENLPNNTWTKIRQEAQRNPESAVEIEKNKAARAHRLRENGEFGDNIDEIPRTREEALQRGTARKNQWGDPLD